jgi:Zn finger protein HypA/HybF involved in hydrogenase expression
MGSIVDFRRTLDQELGALIRGASLECLVCGEFVMKKQQACFCPECGSLTGDPEAVETGLQLASQAG